MLLDILNLFLHNLIWLTLIKRVFVVAGASRFLRILAAATGLHLTLTTLAPGGPGPIAGPKTSLGKVKCLFTQVLRSFGASGSLESFEFPGLSAPIEQILCQNMPNSTVIHLVVLYQLLDVELVNHVVVDYGDALLRVQQGAYAAAGDAVPEHILVVLFLLFLVLYF